MDQTPNPNNGKFQIPMSEAFITQLLGFGILNYWNFKNLCRFRECSFIKKQ